MEIAEIMGLLEEHGIDSRESGQSLAVQYCPECGKKKYKVLFRLSDGDEPLLGKCMSGSCGQGYSTVSYMIKLGIPYADIMAAHGKDPVKDLEKMSDTAVKEVIQPSFNAPKGIDISEFFDVEILPNHPASLYAISRGYVKALSKNIKIDLNTSSVVFISYKGDTPVGYQKRFIISTGQKTDTAKDFDAGSNLIHFAGNGDIVLVEGPFTGVSAWHYGFDAFVTFGSNVSETQLIMIADYARNTRKSILVARENDDAGHKYYETIYNYFAWRGIEVKAVEPEIGSDLNDSWKVGKRFVISEIYVNNAIGNVAEMW